MDDDIDGEKLVEEGVEEDESCHKDDECDEGYDDADDATKGAWPGAGNQHDVHHDSHDGHHDSHDGYGSHEPGWNNSQQWASNAGWNANRDEMWQSNNWYGSQSNNWGSNTEPEPQHGMAKLSWQAWHGHVKQEEADDEVAETRGILKTRGDASQDSKCMQLSLKRDAASMLKDAKDVDVDTNSVLLHALNGD